MKNFIKSLLVLGAGAFLLGGNVAYAQKDSVFSYTGSMQTWTVPSCVGFITIEAQGAQGGTGATYSSWPGGNGGLGADVKATYSVSSGTVLYIYVGGQALFNGGGAAQSYGGGGNGGDASDVRMGGVALVNRIIVAGGGGGGGAEGYGNSYTNNNGGDGGAAGLYGHVGMPGTSQGGNTYVPGQNGNATGGGDGGLGYYDGGAGGGGGADGGGGGGNTCSYCSDVAGLGGTGGACGQNASPYNGNGGCLGVGGSSTNANSNGGGGGGGYYGGGGGSCGNGNQWAGGGGGGGGSSYTGAGTSVTVIDSAITGNGSIIITWFPDTIKTVSANVNTEVSCNGGSDGSANVVATGGTGTYTYTWSPGGETNTTVSGLSAGIYTVTVSDSCGSSKFAMVTITQPAVLSLAKGNKFVGVSNCNGEAWVTASGGTAPFTYSWSPGGGTNDTIKALCNGSYCCTVTDSHGCKDSVCVNILTAGMPSISAAAAINIFPSPNNGLFTVSGLTKGYTVEVYNYMGQKVSSTYAGEPAMQFNITDQASGVYLVRIISLDGKLVKETKIVKTN